MACFIVSNVFYTLTGDTIGLLSFDTKITLGVSELIKMARYLLPPQSLMPRLRSTSQQQRHISPGNFAHQLSRLKWNMEFFLISTFSYIFSLY